MWAPSKEPFLLNLPRYVEHDKKHLYVKFDHPDWWQWWQNDDDISKGWKGWKGWKGDLLTEDSSENVAVTPIPEGKCDHPMSTYLEDIYIVTVTLWLAAWWSSFWYWNWGVPVRKKPPCMLLCVGNCVQICICSKSIPIYEWTWLSYPPLFPGYILSQQPEKVAPQTLVGRVAKHYGSKAHLESSIKFDLWLPWKWLNDKRWVLWSWTYKRIPPTH